MDSSGATPCTTGRPIGEPAFAGVSIGYAPCSRTSTRFASITFVRFAAAWHVPAGAIHGQSWTLGARPGQPSFSAQYEMKLSALPFFAEDLGVITPDVCALRDQFRIPGTRVLQFAFDGNPENPHLPQRYPPNTVAYTGTHDNNTTRGWFEELSRSISGSGCGNTSTGPRATVGKFHDSLDGNRVVVGCGVGDGSSPGCPQLGKRSTDERARPRRR